MGIFDSIGNIFDMAVEPIVSTIFGGPAAGVASIGSTAQRNRVFERSENPMIFTQEGSSGRPFANVQAQMGQSPSNRGFFGDLGQTIGGFGRDVGGFISDIAPALNLLGVGNGLQRTNAGTAITIDTGRPQETAQSGEILGANLGLATNLIGGASRFLRTPGGQGAVGLGGGIIGSLLAGDDSKTPRITRRMKSDVRRIYTMAGMNPDITAQILNNMGTYPRMNFNAGLVFFILTKRFRNDGPVVTKAAVRKTKTTLRRMKGVVDMYNSVCKPTASRRRAAPSRAKAVQLISNK